MLSVCIGVRGCGCPISSSVLRAGTASRPLMNIAPISASAADVITALIIWAMFSTAPLFAGFSESLDIKKCPPARLRAFGSLRYDASLWIAKTMSLALYVTIASSWEAAKSRNNFTLFIVDSVGVACSDAIALNATSIVLLTARA